MAQASAAAPEVKPANRPSSLFPLPPPISDPFPGFLRARGSEIQRNQLAARVPLFRSKAKRIILLYMHGGPSLVDTFDWKPRLLKDPGKALPFEEPRIKFVKTSPLRRFPWEFPPYGQ